MRAGLHGPERRDHAGADQYEYFRPGQPYLVLFGTGIRNASAVTVVIDHEYYTASYAGPQPAVSGLDQMNIALSSSLAGRRVYGPLCDCG
jgi:hypothetical protein